MLRRLYGLSPIALASVSLRSLRYGIDRIDASYDPFEIDTNQTEEGFLEESIQIARPYPAGVPRFHVASGYKGPKLVADRRQICALHGMRRSSAHMRRREEDRLWVCLKGAECRVKPR